MKRLAMLCLSLSALLGCSAYDDGEPSPGAQGMAGATGTFEFKPEDWTPNVTTWWKDTDGIDPATAGCHVGTDSDGAPNGRMFGEACLAEGWAIDGIVSQSESQRATIWKYRDNISEAINAYSPYKNDLSVKVSRVPEFLEKVGQVVAEQYPAFQLIWFGHIGDGNLHLNILKPEELDAEEFKRRCEVVNREVFQLVKIFDGSISAEHGVGLLKKEFLDYSRSESEISYMRQVKRIFDPNGILNPGKIF